jgi:hypothetical protein
VPRTSRSARQSLLETRWLFVDLVVVVIQHFNPFDFSHGNDSITQLYLMLVATTPLTGRAILWVLAPSVVSGQQAAATS